MRLPVKIGIGVVVAGAVVYGAGYGHHLYSQWNNTRDVLPVFTEPGPGTRAPAHDFVGIELGKSTVADATALGVALGADCDNSSMRALMEKNRQKVQQAMADAKAKGEDPDGVTGASQANYHSKKEQNPQVRLSCYIEPDKLTDRRRAPGAKLYGLFIFDSKDLPARHASVQREIADPTVALTEYRAAIDEMTKKLGPPTATHGEPRVDGTVPVGTLLKTEWKFADVTAEVSAVNLSGIRVMERMEVPWPVRADAPVHPTPAAAQ
ncbi:MAG TPA: hypothetical protein VGO62_19925 [Myxococcota bacterium]|jgi:hypothetical protein